MSSAPIIHNLYQLFLYLYDAVCCLVGRHAPSDSASNQARIAPTASRDTGPDQPHETEGTSRGIASTPSAVSFCGASEDAAGGASLQCLDTKRQMVATLPLLISEAEDANLRQALEHHLGETRGHVSDVEEIFRSFGTEPEAPAEPGHGRSQANARDRPDDLQIHLVMDNYGTHQTRSSETGFSATHVYESITRLPAAPGSTRLNAGSGSSPNGKSGAAPIALFANLRTPSASIWPPTTSTPRLRIGQDS